MAASYYLATNSVDVFIFGLLDDGLSLTSGQPTLNYYATEDQLISALSTLTGNPNYYYENLDEGPANPLDGISFLGATGATCSSQTTISGDNVWYLGGNKNDYNGSYISITQGPFTTNGRCSIYRKYNGTNTGIMVFSSVNKALPNVSGFNNFTGTYKLYEGNEGYLYFSGSTYEIPSDPAVQGYVVRGNISDYPNSYLLMIEPQAPSYTGLIAYIQVVEPYDPVLDLTYIHLVDTGTGNAIAYHSTGNNVYITLATSLSLALPPVSDSYSGIGRSYLDISDPTSQYFDLFDDVGSYIGATGALGGYVHIEKLGQEYDLRAYVTAYWGNLGPFTRVRLNSITYEDSGVPISWSITI